MTELIRGLRNIKPRHRGCVATIGNFDGVHRGHQALLKKVQQKAQALQVPSLVITFEPHPLEFFAPDKAAPRLTRWREKFSALADCGIDRVLVVRFDEHFAKLTAEEFIEQVLCKYLGIQHIIIGDDFRFGNKRQGDFEFLKNAGARLGFGVENMPSYTMDGERVSSTLVRDALVAGNHAQVKKLLGRPYSMMGRVVYGDQRGRVLGFPTANIYLHRAVTPVRGVYTVQMQGIADHSLPGVANVGIRPTIGGTRALLEVHLFDFNQEIYGRHVQVEFCEKIRDEKKFDNLDLLKAQIGQDATTAKNYFKKNGE